MNWDTDRIKSAIDIRDLASQYAELRRWSAGELAGPCPKCGGTDRFHVRADWWYCNQCYPYDNGKPHDAIAFVQWVRDCGFTEACRLLQGGVVQSERRVQPVVPRAREYDWPDGEWQVNAKGHVVQGVAALRSAQGKAVRRYLERRGLRQETWEAFSIGAVRWKTVKSQRWSPAVAMPWFIGEHIVNLKLRFPCGTNENGDRYNSKKGGQAILFGAQLLGAHLETLVMCEGELNAMSLWQAVGDLGRRDRVDVVSFGGERQAGDHPLRLARRYHRVVVWADEGAQSQAPAGKLALTHAGRILALQSPDGLDANDILQRGQLSEFVALALERLGDAAGGERTRRPQWARVTLIMPTDTPLRLPADARTLQDGSIEATFTADGLHRAVVGAGIVTEPA